MTIPLLSCVTLLIVAIFWHQRRALSENPIFQRLAVVIIIAVRGIAWGAFTGSLIGALLGLPIFGIGAIFGFLVGFLIGSGVGGTTGLLMGTATILVFFPPTNARRYRRHIAACCAITAGFSTWVVSKDLFLTTGGSELYLLFLPPLLAAALAIPISQKLAGWYISNIATIRSNRRLVQKNPA